MGLVRLRWRGMGMGMGLVGMRRVGVEVEVEVGMEVEVVDRLSSRVWLGRWRVVLGICWRVLALLLLLCCREGVGEIGSVILVRTSGRNRRRKGLKVVMIHEFNDVLRVRSRSQCSIMIPPCHFVRILADECPLDTTNDRSWWCAEALSRSALQQYA